MPRGSSPGEHRGGRAVGTPNKFGEQRALAVEREGKRLPPANLLVIAENSMAMAARFQPDLTDPETKERRANPQYNEERYAFWLDRSREALRDAAPYYSPKLHAIGAATRVRRHQGLGNTQRLGALSNLTLACAPHAPTILARATKPRPGEASPWRGYRVLGSDLGRQGSSIGRAIRRAIASSAACTRTTATNPTLNTNSCVAGGARSIRSGCI